MESWFTYLTGVEEHSPEQVRSQLHLEGSCLTSLANNKSYECGTLEIPTLAELRKNSSLVQALGQLKVRELIGNVQDFQLDPQNEGCLFQAASQFNLLEMIDSRTIPEEGIGIYEYDRTQGPACAIACGAGTIYRNYLVPLEGQIGQSKKLQIDCMEDLSIPLGNQMNHRWKMQNGYLLIKSKEALDVINKKILAISHEEREALKGKLKIGLQWNTQVTLHNCQHLLSQAYCSALPVSYNELPPQLWEPFARLILEAAYEATMHAALINFQQTGKSKVFLTLLGGGAFGNDTDWIFESINKVMDTFEHTPLQVYFISYQHPHPRIEEILRA
ncbi:MAG: hypothetical protein AAF696_20555 [Bacteroidota bacterium]